MTNREAPLVALGPSGSPGWLEEAIRDGGGEVVDLAECEAIVWADARNPEGLADAMDEAPNLRWVQLPFAGIENFTEFLDDDYTWTCGKGVYAEPVAELALTLGVTGLRNVGAYAKSKSWSGPAGRNLLGGRVTILGGGGITESLVRLLQPWDCHVTVVRNHVQHMDGVDDVLESDRFADALPGADLVVLALSLTPETEGLFGRDEFAMMEDHAWIVNVARGRHIITDHLVEALQSSTIGGAGLDVTDPEPLPDDHPLWSLPNCIITPHVGNTPEMAKPLLAARVTENVRRYRKGEELLGLVDVEAGYEHPRVDAGNNLGAVTGADDATHYTTLGVSRVATQPEIREAYRQRAREKHPDRQAVGSAVGLDSMADINEAYRVLSDPARRAVYDATLRGTGSAVPPSDGGWGSAAGTGQSDDWDDGDRFAGTRDTFYSGHPSHLGPARVPWRMLVFCGTLAVVGVVVLAQFNKPGEPTAPDGILRIGDCVAIEPNGDAREVRCIGNTAEPSSLDLVVTAFVPFGATCPGLTVPHRDRQGMGVACIPID